MLSDLLIYDVEAFVDQPSQEKIAGFPNGSVLQTFRLGVFRHLRLSHGEVERESQIRTKYLAEVWDFILGKTRPKNTLHCVAHNAYYDMSQIGVWQKIKNKELTLVNSIPSKIHPRSWKKPLFIAESPPLIIDTYCLRGNKITWFDSVNYWKMSLKSIGKSIGEYKSGIPGWLMPDDECFAYCEQDVKVLSTAILGLIREIRDEGLGRMKLTAPSLAYSVYHKMYEKKRIALHHNATAKQLERRGYYGGAVLVNLHGKRNRAVWQYDVKSIYPSVMKECLYPCELQSFVERSDDEYDIPFNCGLACSADVYIDTMERTYPKRVKGGIYHVNGNYWTTLCGPELLYAVKNNHAKAFGSYAIYKIRNLFAEFIDYWWNRRLEAIKAGNGPKNQLAKLLMNSLYGKYGQRNPIWEFEDITPPDDYEEWGFWIESVDGLESECRNIGGLVQVKQELGEWSKGFPAISAWVTAYAREKMRLLRDVVTAKHWIYQAVDSLIVTREGRLNLERSGNIAENVLGKLELNYVGSEVDIRGINNYSIDEKHVRGSIKARAKQISKNTWREFRFQGINTILHNPDQLGVVVGPIYKTMQEKFDRGTVNADGTVTPLRLDEPLENRLTVSGRQGFFTRGIRKHFDGSIESCSAELREATCGQNVNGGFDSVQDVI